MRTKGIGPRNLGMSPLKVTGGPGRKGKKSVTPDAMTTPAEADRQARLKAVRENSIAMKEERALLAKRKRGSNLGVGQDEMAVLHRLQEKGRTKDIKKS